MKIRTIRKYEPATFTIQSSTESKDRTEIINLTYEEMEAIILTNSDNLSQRDAAENMNISQPTFNCLLNSAYGKLAHFLLNGKMLQIQGGNYMIAQAERKFLCYDCNAVFGAPYGTPRPDRCPQCGSTNIHRHPDDTGARHRGGRGRGGGGMGGMGGGRGMGQGGAGRGGGRGGNRGPNRF